MRRQRRAAAGRRRRAQGRGLCRAFDANRGLLLPPCVSPTLAEARRRPAAGRPAVIGTAAEAVIAASGRAAISICRPQATCRSPRTSLGSQRSLAAADAHAVAALSPRARCQAASRAAAAGQLRCDFNPLLPPPLHCSRRIHAEASTRHGRPTTSPNFLPCPGISGDRHGTG